MKRQKGALLRRLLRLLNRREKRQLALLAPALLLNGIAEVATLAAIAPFMSLLTNPDSVQEEGLTRTLFQRLPFETQSSFFVFIGLLVMTLLILCNALHAVTTYAVLRFSWMRNHTLSSRLLESYLHRPYEYFVTRNTADLSANILSETQAIINGLLLQGLLFISAITTAVFLLVGLVLLDPVVAVCAGTSFGALYGALFWMIRKRITRLGQTRTQSQRRRFRLASEILASAKEAKILGVERVMLMKYREPSVLFARAMSAQLSWSQIPKYVLELVAFASLLAVAMLMIGRGSDITAVATTLGVYVFAAYRLLPGIQTIFSAVSSFRFNAAALEKVEEDLGSPVDRFRPIEGISSLSQSIELRGVSYRYPTMDTEVISGVELTISRGEWVAIVGPTGSGKTTIADLLLGLLPPTSGSLVLDGQSLLGTEVVGWQRLVAYVPQSIFLLDDSVEQNIAFGVDPERIDHERVRRAAQIAQISEFIENDLPDGYNSSVGERGVRLSGGERQRIGIARALYTERPFLLLDEATSALDPSTEASFFAALRASHADRTVVSIAHRHSTTLAFDRVVLMVGGSVGQVGTPDDVIRGRGMFSSIHVPGS